MIEKVSLDNFYVMILEEEKNERKTRAETMLFCLTKDASVAYHGHRGVFV